MPFSSQSSKEYIPVINSLAKPGYTSKYSGQLNDVIDKIINREDFTYDINSDPIYGQYKNQYVNLGKEAVQNAVAATSALTGGYGNSYAATAASQANQQYLTKMNNEIPQLMDAAMKKYQMEQENLQAQFGMLQGEENRQYGMYRDETSDYYTDLANYTNAYKGALSQEDTEAERAYEKERAAVSDAQWQQNYDYQMQRDQIKDEQWQKEWELKQLQEAAKKAQSTKSSSGRKSSGSKSTSDNSSFFKMKGTAAVKTYSGNKVDTSRNATLSVTKRNQLMNELLSAKSESEAQKLLNQWAYDGQISEGDYDHLADLYNQAKERGIKKFTVNGKK